MLDSSLKLALVLKAVDQMTGPIKGMESATLGSLKAIEAQVDRLSDTALRVGASLSVAGAGLIASLKAPIEAFAEVERVMTEASLPFMKTGGKLDPIFHEIQPVIERLGDLLPGTTADFGEMAGAMRAAGLDAEAIRDGGLEAAGALKILGKLTNEEAGALSVRLSKALEISGRDFVGFANILQKTSFAAGLSIRELGTAMPYFASKLKAYGLTGLEGAQFTSRWLTAIREGTGLAGSELGTAFGGMLEQLPQIELKLKHGRGWKMKEAAHLIGKYGLGDLNRKVFDAQGQFSETGLLNFLDALNTRITSQKERLNLLGELFNDVGARAAMGIKKDTLELANRKLKDQADLSDRLNKVLGTLSALWEAATGTLKNAAAAIGEALGPELKALVGLLNKVASGIRTWTREHPALTKALVLTVAGVGALTFTAGVALTGIGLLGKGVSTVIEGFTNWRKLIEAGRIALKGLGAQAMATAAQIRAAELSGGVTLPAPVTKKPPLAESIRPASVPIPSPTPVPIPTPMRISAQPLVPKPLRPNVQAPGVFRAPQLPPVLQAVRVPKPAPILGSVAATALPEAASFRFEKAATRARSFKKVSVQAFEFRPVPLPALQLPEVASPTLEALKAARNQAVARDVLRRYQAARAARLAGSAAQAVTAIPVGRLTGLWNVMRAPLSVAPLLSAKTAIWSLAGSLAKIPGAGWMAAAALAIIGTTVIKYWGPIQRFFKGVAEGFADIWKYGGIGETFKEAFESIADALGEVFKAIFQTSDSAEALKRAFEVGRAVGLSLAVSLGVVAKVVWVVGKGIAAVVNWIATLTDATVRFGKTALQVMGAAWKAKNYDFAGAKQDLQEIQKIWKGFGEKTTDRMIGKNIRGENEGAPEPGALPASHFVKHALSGQRIEIATFLDARNYRVELSRALKAIPKGAKLTPEQIRMQQHLERMNKIIEGYRKGQKPAEEAERTSPAAASTGRPAQRSQETRSIRHAAQDAPDRRHESIPTRFEATITVTGIQSPDLDQRIQTAIQQALKAFEQKLQRQPALAWSR